MTHEEKKSEELTASERRKRVRKHVPEVQSRLRADYVEAPKIIRDASGIRLYGKRIKSIIFTTDISLIANTDADAVLAVFPFTPQPSIYEAISHTTFSPFLAGVGGGTTNGRRSAKMATFAEAFGASAVVLNAPASLETIALVDEEVDCPIVCTIISEHMDIESRLKAGVNIFNVSAAKKTPQVIRQIRKNYPYIPIMATGGPSDESIRETIDAGANAITFTPPSNSEIFHAKMEQYRDEAEAIHNDKDSDLFI